MYRLALVLVLLAALFCGSAVRATAETFWISTTGNDTTGFGTVDLPWRTLDFALNVGVPTNGGHLVRVMPGHYDDSIIVYRAFDSEVLVQSNRPYHAVLTNLSGNGTILGVYVNGPANLAFEGFVFNAEGSTGAKCTTRTSSMVHFQNASNVRFENNIVYGNNREPYCNDLVKVNRSGPPWYLRNVTIRGNVFYDHAQLNGNEIIDVVRAGEIDITGNIFFSDLGLNQANNFVTLKQEVTGDEVPADARSPRHRIDGNIFLNWEGNAGDAMLNFGGDGVASYEISDALVENNLFVCNSPNPMDAPFQFKGVRDVTVRANTIVGDLPSTAFGFLVGTTGLNPIVQDLFIYNNIFADPTGTMGPMFCLTFGLTDNDSFVLDHNLFWNGGNALPAGGGVLPNVDANRVEGDPMLQANHGGLVLPRWDTVEHRFASGAATIREEFARLVETYGALSLGSAAAGAANPANQPERDIRGWTRDGAPDIGAYEIAPPTGAQSPSWFSLSQNAPNPFHATSRFDFVLATDADVELDLFDVRGRRVRTLADQHMLAGRHDVTLDGRDLAGGIYFYRLKVGDREETRRCVVLR